MEKGADTLAQVCSKARRKLFYLSQVPKICKGSDAVYLGIDEAGRGPVLGDMTYSAAYWRECDNDSIKKLGYDGECERVSKFSLLFCGNHMRYCRFQGLVISAKGKLLQRNCSGQNTHPIQ